MDAVKAAMLMEMVVDGWGILGVGNGTILDIPEVSSQVVIVYRTSAADHIFRTFHDGPGSGGVIVCTKPSKHVQSWSLGPWTVGSALIRPMSGLAVWRPPGCVGLRSCRPPGAVR